MLHSFDFIYMTKNFQYDAYSKHEMYIAYDVQAQI